VKFEALVELSSQSMLWEDLEYGLIALDNLCKTKNEEFGK